MKSTDTPPTTPRPLGFWLRVTDALLRRAVDDALATEGVGRREWRALNVVDGSVTASGATERLSRGKKLRALIERGWVAQVDGAWALTDTGRAAKARLAEKVDGVKATSAESVSADDYATTIASLEAIARGLGWDETQPMPRRPHRRGHRGRGHRFGSHHHGHGHGFGHSHRFGHGRRVDHGCHPGTAAAHAGASSGAEHGFERGFEAGFRAARAEG